MNRVIFLPTIQHTGTWFVMELLRMHPEVKQYIEIHLLKSVSYTGVLCPQVQAKGEAFSQEGITILQQHIPLWEKTTGLFSPGNGADSLLFAGLVCACPTVLPLRDPLLSIITAKNRRFKNNLDMDVVFLVWIWAQAVRDFEALNEVAHPCYFPIDLLSATDPGSRRNAMRQLFLSCGLPVDNVFRKVGEENHLLWSDLTTLAREWPLVSPTKGKHESKKKYTQGDKGYFEKTMKEEWEELKKAEPLLRPFLEKFGYTNLLWWS